MKIKVEILHQDDSVVVINKPANFLSIPDRFRADIPNAYSFLKNKFGEIYTVHRLDRETSGIMVFAKDTATHKILNEQFEQRKVEKIYLALVKGRLPNEEGVIDKAITKHPVIAGKMIVAAKGKASISEFKVTERFKNYTLVEVNIKTGRTHQIRVHMASLGHPLAVDGLYGKKKTFMLSEVKGKKYKKNRNEEERPLASRCTLHSQRLSFNHPISGEQLVFEADPPKDMRAVIQQLRKWDIAI